MSAISRQQREYARPALFDRPLDLTWVTLEVILFAGLVLASVITHLWALDRMAMHHDESIHAWSSWRFYTGAGVFNCAAGRVASSYCYDPVFHGPSLYVLTFAAYFLFGDGDAQARLPQALAGIGMVASAWMLRPYLGWRGTLIAAALLAFTPSLLYYTRFARHDGLMVLWELWMVIGFFRYLDTSHPRYLYLLAAGAALAIATHELYYILFFLFGSFVLIRALNELLPRRNLLVAMLAFLSVMLIVMLVNPPLTPNLRAGGLALLMATITGLGLLMIRVWDTTPVLVPQALALWRERRTLWVALGVLGAIYVLLYGVFFTDPRGIIDGLYQGLAYWLGSQHEFARGDQPWYYYLLQMPLYEPIALFGSIGAAIYLFSRPQPLWPRLEQASDETQASADTQLAPGDESDGQPGAERVTTDNLAMPDPSTQTGVAADVKEQPSGTLTLPHDWPPQEEPEASATNSRHLAEIEGWETFADARPVVLPPASPAAALPAIAAQPLFPLFLVFWFIGALVAFSWAGEKMPWLVTHIALPGNLLAAWGLGRLVDFVSDGAPAAQLEPSRWRTWKLLVPPALILLLIALVVALGRLGGASEDLRGQASLLQGLIPLGVVGLLIFGLLTIAQQIGPRVTLALCGLTIAGLLGIYTIRATWMVVYDHPDTPRELLVYTQSTPDIPLIVEELRTLAIAQTRNARSAGDPIGGQTMPVILDSGDTNSEGSLAWPFEWYLRDFQRVERRNADFFRNATADSFQVTVDARQPEGEREPAPVVLVSVPHITDATRQALEENYVKRYDTKLNWWFPEGNKCDPQAPGYKRFYYSSATIDEARKDCNNQNLDPARFGSPIAPLLWPFDRSHWADTARFVLFRDLPAPLRLDGREMQVWVRKDLAASGASQAGEGSGVLKLVAEALIGAPGSEPGQLNQPRGVAVDGQGRLYIADTGSHRIQVFGPDGALLRAFGSQGSEAGQFNEPRGVAVDGQGNIYVADTWNARIVKLDPNGAFVRSWGEGRQDFGGGRRATMTDGTVEGNAAEPLGFFGPRGIAVDERGHVYIADTGNKRIVVTDSEGTYLYQWGYEGSEPGAFNEPVSVAVDGQGNVYVADVWNGRVQMFQRGEQGRVTPAPIVTWRVAGWQPNTYDDPYIAASAGGQVFVSVPSRNLVLYANSRGDVLMRWGGKGEDFASLNVPSGLAVGPDGRIYVADRGNGRVLRFRLPQFIPEQQEGQRPR